MGESEEIVGISLANDLRIGMAGIDMRTSIFLSNLIVIMKLRPISEPSLKILFLAEDTVAGANYDKISFSDLNTKQMRILSENGFWKAIAGKSDDEIVCMMKNHVIEPDLSSKLANILVFLAFLSLHHSGTVLHCALAHKDGKGVIFVGGSGAGKTTASNRLPATWKSLCDDATWIVRDEQGKFWAHPLPTCSRFQSCSSWDSWEVAKAVPLKGIFFLNQSKIDSIQAINTADTMHLLKESSRYILRSLYPSMNPEEIRALNFRIFEFIYGLTDEVPSYILNISLTGEFWKVIERALDEIMITKFE
jgi:SynChlorMet cassette protein ScmC